MITAEERTARARKAARVRWAWGTEGRQLRAEMYYRRLHRAILTGDPQWLAEHRKADLSRMLFGTPHPWDRERP